MSIQTVIHAYYFDISKTEQKKEYQALKAKLESQGLECFETCGGASHHMLDIDGYTLDLESEYLFDDQWNTAPLKGSDKGLRVFDWAQDALSYKLTNENIKRGHYLEQTKEMKNLRSNRVKCGYCGKQELRAKGLVFCDKCLDSPYLKESDLRLTRMISVTDKSHDEIVELTEAEKAWLLPQYLDAQIHGTTKRGMERIKRQREDLENELTSKIKHAQTKHDGLIWLLDRGINIENVIYYDHTDMFSFGWRQAIGETLKEQLTEKLEGFPFNYQFVNPRV